MDFEKWIKEPNIHENDYIFDNWEFHKCEIPQKSHNHGPAIDICFEDKDGYLFVTNREYGSQVNFCPMCGYEAKIKITPPS